MRRSYRHSRRPWVTFYRIISRRPIKMIKIKIEMTGTTGGAANENRQDRIRYRK